MLIYISKLRFLMKYILVFHPFMPKNIYRAKLSFNIKQATNYIINVKRDLLNSRLMLEVNRTVRIINTISVRFG